MKKVKIGSVGLGRLGYEHACNIANLVPGAELTALCDVDEKRVKEVAAELGVPYTYTDVAEMVKNPELDAIVIVSPSMYHADHIKLALDAGKHVFCDKPLDTTIEKCKQAEKAVEAHPDKVFMLGFMRRFDDSYAEAKQRIDNGDIGKVVLVRSYTQDPRTTIEGTLKFAPHSGGQFLDMCVHDIDLIRWFTGSNIKKVWGIGGVFEFDLYRELNDADNAAATVQCENGAMGFMFTNRTHGAGCNVETEIIGTHGRTVTTLKATGQDRFHNYFFPFTEGFDYAAANDFDSVRHKADEMTCAVMMELVQGEGGVLPLEPDFVKQVEAFCRERDILLIIDEVQTGIGRTGSLFCFQQYGIRPDVVTMAKGLGGGVPIGAVLAAESCSNVLTPGTHATTFGGTPLVCAAANAVLDTVGDGQFLAQVKEKGEYLKSGILSIGSPNILGVRGMGLMLGIIVEDGKHAAYANKLIEKGVLALTAGKNAVRLLPPLTISREEMDEALTIMKEVF